MSEENHPREDSPAKGSPHEWASFCAGYADAKMRYGKELAALKAKHQDCVSRKEYDKLHKKWALTVKPYAVEKLCVHAPVTSANKWVKGPDCPLDEELSTLRAELEKSKNGPCSAIGPEAGLSTTSCSGLRAELADTKESLVVETERAKLHLDDLNKSLSAHDQTRKGAARLRDALINARHSCTPPDSQGEGEVQAIVGRALTATASIGSWHEAMILRAKADGLELSKYSDDRECEAWAKALRTEATTLDKGNQTKGEGG